MNYPVPTSAFSSYLLENPLSEHEGGWNIRAELPVEYSAIISDDLFSINNTALLQPGAAQQQGIQLLVVDSEVLRLHGERIGTWFDHHNIAIKIFSLDVSESLKRVETTMKIVDQFERHGVLRRDKPFIAIGGGVLLDLAGFAASLYRRGIPHIRVPTNLMALIDASLGVKSGVNVGDRRNRLGTYNAPSAVYLDRRFLRTVSPRDIANGLGEILKLAIIKDEVLFGLLEAGAETLWRQKLQDHRWAPAVIRRSVRGMLEELAPNLWERNLSRCVDFGHTFSPLAEMRALPELLHGEAVALDVLISCFIAAGRGILSRHDLTRVRGTMARLGLPMRHPAFADTDTLWESLADATLHRNGQQRLPLPNGIGECVFVNDLSRGELERAVAEWAVS